MIKLWKFHLTVPESSKITQANSGNYGNNVFNTVFEMSLRIILLTSSSPDLYFTSTRVLVLDFINCYAEKFGLAETNLHGDNNFMYAEIAGRRGLVLEAIKKLVKQGMLKIQTKNGYRYKITNTGLEFARKLSSTYAQEYRRISKLTVSKYGFEEDEKLIRLIQNYSLTELKG
ncbi:ABC-three component system middle component 2 [Veillonella sp.]|uniref:ABC-three component system middle component 2 n=1 Tax=Veillonella sp. TaxID=1926307 RepID=UPI0025D3141F|nr:ABC-three component system middle component 2 [Veillonella sp.]